MIFFSFNARTKISVAYFFGANDQVCIPTYETSGVGKDAIITKDAIGVGGFTAYNGYDIHQNLQLRGNYTEYKYEHDGKSYYNSFYSIVLTESCTMAKPYKTDTYPLMPKIDKTFMGMMD